MSAAHRPRKRFGQNFLSDQRFIDQIISVINPQPSDALVEIGPGQGALTAPLLAAAGKLIAIELDRDLIEPLKAKCELIGQLQLHQADALQFDFSSLGKTPLRIVGNLPYNISTPLLLQLFSYANQIQDMHFMLQDEVGKRLAASPGNKDYGRLSIMTQYHCQVTRLFTVPPQAFYPAPKVTSCFVRLVPHAHIEQPVGDLAAFSALLAKAFGQRRKTLRNSLKGWIDETALTALGIDPGARPEQLSVNDFVALSHAVRR